MNEFEAIQRFFHRPSTVDLGIGDDAALLRVSAGHQLVVAADMSVVDTHFFTDAHPYDIGWKSLAVNVSDMAAMGAQPRWATLAIALPEVDGAWLQPFSEGLFACADAFGVSLIGGDTTRGPLNIAISILGEVPTGQALRRDGAQVGDDVWVSGLLGQAALWLQMRLEQLVLTPAEATQYAVAMHRPQPRVALGLALRGIAHSALDISDGLLSDLGHILKASGVGAQLEWPAIPRPAPQSVRDACLQQAVLAGGDDYELCFTAPVARRAEVLAVGQRLGLAVARIGSITAEAGLHVVAAGAELSIYTKGYDHFAS